MFFRSKSDSVWSCAEPLHAPVRTGEYFRLPLGTRSLLPTTIATKSTWQLAYLQRLHCLVVSARATEPHDGHTLLLLYTIQPEQTPTNTHSTGASRLALFLARPYTVLLLHCNPFGIRRGPAAYVRVNEAAHGGIVDHWSDRNHHASPDL